MNLLLWQDSDAPDASGAVDDPRLSTFFFAALMGRFDMGGVRETIDAEVMNDDVLVDPKETSSRGPLAASF
jgi:hypothetical protein